MIAALRALSSGWSWFEHAGEFDGRHNAGSLPDLSWIRPKEGGYKCDIYAGPTAVMEGVGATPAAAFADALARRVLS